MRNANLPVAQEGYPFIGLFAFITLIFALLGWGFLAVILLALTLFTIYFFRNPERNPPPGEGLVIAPADGEVIFVGNVEENHYSMGPVQKISIFMSVFNVHINRVPLSGKVVDMFYRRGEFFNASLDKASEQNEQGGILLEDEKGRRILFVQIAGLIARRIVTYPVIGDLLRVGQRYGLIRFGSRVDVYLPTDCSIQVSLGDKTIAGESILGRWNDN
ncbi:phosphatidylserine decarboxylase family protein [Geopsychrobacter electrodiphilus]|uniref:phosphatidylserine decarboxylase family protein n=1 Tax=Geopsychrobacter electrodiphilus TaxID=225196 RepID=UPI0003648D13|nr:phosphatidylserine decarboxylase family protein [Geopsychrobacter electrodiphilus]